jgi:hypothetical protein
MRPLLTVALLLVATTPVAADDDLTVLKADGDNPAPRMLRAHLLAEAQKLFDARRATVAALKTPDDVHKRQQELRAKFVAALGGFPEKTPLNARVVGTNHRDGSRVERVVYDRVRKADARTWAITTVAHTGEKSFAGDGGPAVKALFGNIYCVALDPRGDMLYLANLDNRRIRCIDLTTVACTPGPDARS